MRYCGIELDGFISKFFSFLKEEKAYYNFKKIIMRNHDFRNKPNYKAFFEGLIVRQRIENNRPIDCLYSVDLFCLWSDSKNGFSYWGKLYLEWLCITYEMGLWDMTVLKHHSGSINYITSRLTNGVPSLIREILPERYHEIYEDILNNIK